MASLSGFSAREIAERLNTVKATGLNGELLEYWKRSTPAFPDDELLPGLRKLAIEVQQDLRTGPESTIADLREMQRIIINRQALTVDLTLDGAQLGQIEPTLTTFLESIPNTAHQDRGNSRAIAQKDPFMANLKHRYKLVKTEFPWYVALEDPRGTTASMVFSADFPGYKQIDRDSLLKLLSSNLAAGSGPHTFFMKTQEDGLADGSAVYSDPRLRALHYFAARSPDISSLLQLVNSIAQTIPKLQDPSLIDYALQETFPTPRSMLTFTERGRGIAKDIRDGNDPETVRRFSLAILKLRNEPNLLSELMSAAMGSICPVLVKAECARQQRDSGSLFFFIGPERLLSDAERKLKMPKLLRLYTADFWIDYPAMSVQTRSTGGHLRKTMPRGRCLPISPTAPHPDQCCCSTLAIAFFARRVECTMRSGQSQRMKQYPQAYGPEMAIRNWDATKTEAPVELLHTGFELAYFLVPDRSGAVAILARALEKLRVQSRRELKRLYWRDKHTERSIRRIARGDVDILQWLIMFEAEQDERAQERVGGVSSAGMIIRYIKHLVQITTALSSFYVNVGLTRILHNYSTSEAQSIYERLTSRYLGPDEYRRGKSTLIDKIAERFGSFLKLARADHGELRFERSDQQQEFTQIAAECLKALTPWSTRARCAQFMTTNGAGMKLKLPYEDAKADQNEIELRCCHILIEPACYSQLMEDLAFDQPDTKLALPRFFMPEKQENNGDNNAQPPFPPELSKEEIDQIQRRLAMTDARRRNINPRMVKISIDGVEQTHVNLARQSQFQIALEAGASLIEVRGEDEHGELLLATHVISYANDGFDSAAATARLQ